MSELLDFYQQQAIAKSSNIPWLADLQKKAMADFKALGFPSRHVEDWKYTTVDSFLKQPFSSDKTSPLTENISSPSIIPNGHSITLTNGMVTGLERLTTLPTGVIVQPLSQALLEHGEKIKPYLGQILEQQHGFHALNTAMLQEGLFIYFPKDVQLTTPLCLNHWQDKMNQAMYIRHLIVLEEGSSASIVENYEGDEHSSYFTNTITEVHLAANAKLTHYKVQRESQLAYHVGHLAVKQAAKSQLDSHSFSIGGKLVRSDIVIELQAPEAQCLMNGIYAPMDNQHIDHHTIVKHEAPRCRSEQDYKGILSGHSRAVFNGRVIVAKGAQHTEAKQQNKNLLLSANTEIDTKPQLEIFADDVVCTHGATVGQLDEEALFYLATRGIGRAEASRYLVQAFATENLRHFANQEFGAWIAALLSSWVKL